MSKADGPGKHKAGRQGGAPKNTTNQSSMKKPGASGTGAPQPKTTSQRDRIRLLQHLLKKDDLSASARAGIERELEKLQAAQKDAARVERERKLAVKYHKVRFFERVKIERHISQLRRTIKGQAGGTATAEQQAELDKWEKDLLYVRNFPPGEKYVSLLRNAETPEAQERLVAERQRLHGLVAERVAAAEQAAADAAALNDADEGAGLGTTGAKPQPLQAAQRSAGVVKAAAAGTSTKAGSSARTQGHKAAANAPEDGGIAELDDEFFLSADDDGDGDDDDGVAGAQGLRQGPAATAAAPTARSWPKPQLDNEDSSSSEEDDGQRNGSGKHAGPVASAATKPDGLQSKVDRGELGQGRLRKLQQKERVKAAGQSRGAHAVQGPGAAAEGEHPGKHKRRQHGAGVPDEGAHGSDAGIEPGAGAGAQKQEAGPERKRRRRRQAKAPGTGAQ